MSINDFEIMRRIGKHNFRNLNDKDTLDWGQ